MKLIIPNGFFFLSISSSEMWIQETLITYCVWIKAEGLLIITVTESIHWIPEIIFGSGVVDQQ